MQHVTVDLGVMLYYYLICYTLIIIVLCFTFISNSTNNSHSWNVISNSVTGIRVLLFSCLLALTGLPPMFMLAPKLHLICFLFIRSNIIGIAITLTLIFLGWFVYYSALRSFSQTSNSNKLTTSTSLRLTTKMGTILAALLLTLVLAPFFVDDLILWVYFFIGI